VVRGRVKLLAAVHSHQPVEAADYVQTVVVGYARHTAASGLHGWY